MGKSRRRRTGTRFHLAAHLVLCLGQIGRILRIKAADRELWQGEISEGPLTLDNTSLFGELEGGIAGTITFLRGEDSQAIDPLFTEIYGATSSAFRGVTSVVMPRLYNGNTGRFTPLEFTIEKITDHVENWYPQTATIPIVGEISNSQFYISMDLSGSLGDGGEVLQQQNAIALVELIRDNAGSVPNDIQIVLWSAVVTNTFICRDCQESDYQAAIDFLDEFGATPVPGGTSFQAGVSLAPDFFIGPKRRILVFSSDGGITIGSAAGALATLDTISGLETFTFHVGGVSGNTALLDNTPDDGVPVLTNENVVATSISAVFSQGNLMNPIHINRDVVFDRQKGGQADASIFDDTWEASADTLFQERFGLTFKYGETRAGMDFIEDVNEYINGGIRINRETGKYQHVLVRPVADTASLPVFDDTNATFSEPTYPAPDELLTKVSVQFRDIRTGRDASANAWAGRRQGSGERGETLDLPAIRTRELAARVAQREVDERSSIAVSGEFVSTSVPPSLNIFDACIIQSNQFDIEPTIVRIREIVDPPSGSAKTVVRYWEEVFTSPEAPFFEPPANVLVDRSAKPIVHRYVNELNYYDLARELGDDEAQASLNDDPDNGLLVYTGAAANSFQNDYTATVDPELDGTFERVSGAAPFCPLTFLQEAVSRRADETRLLVSDDVTLENVELGSVAVIGSEFVRIDAIVDHETDASLKYLDVGRGCLDSVPESHETGATVIFYSGFFDSNEEPYAAGEQVDVQLLTRTRVNELSPFFAPVDRVTFASRASRPYPVGNFQIDGDFELPLIGASHSWTWAHRNRLQQTGDFVEDHTVGDIGPEPNVTYRVEVAALDSDSMELTPLVVSEDVGANTTYTFNSSLTPIPGEASFVVQRVFSVRDDGGGNIYESLFAPAITTSLSSNTFDSSIATFDASQPTFDEVT